MDCQNNLAICKTKVCNMDKFKSHGGSAFQGVFIATGRVELAVAAENSPMNGGQGGESVEDTFFSSSIAEQKQE